MRHADPHPSGRELDVLASLWALESATVAEVQSDLADRFEFEWAYTSVLTMLRRIEIKGRASRYRDGQGHRYVATLSREHVREEALRRLQYSLFDGSVETMIAMLQRQSIRWLFEQNKLNAEKSGEG